MTRIGIVGSEGKKFTSKTEAKAREIIRELLSEHDVVISGGCHLGGVDIYAAEEGRKLGLEVIEHVPAVKKWDGGYKQRNLKIVNDSDKVICITLKKLPDTYKGMTFKLCYHCGTDDHVKSGGCWTMKQAKLAGKEWELIVIDEDDL